MAQPASLLLQVLSAWLVCCLCLAPAVRGQTDPVGTVAFAGRGSAQSAAAVASLASSYRFVTTAVRNNFAGSSSDLDALTAVGNGSAAYAVIDDLQASAIPSGTLAVPLLGAALVLPYNLNSLGSASVSTLMQLVKLDMKTIGLIFAGNITHWNDSQILALNTNATYSYWAGLEASSSAITVVVRGDATPTTRAFTRALATASTAFAEAVGVSDLPAWPASFVQATGASGVLTAVLNTPGAIGFIDLPSWTSTSGVPYASIRNLNKQNVLPTIANVQRLMADNAKSFKASSSMVANLVDGNNAATWPLGWMNYLVTPTGNFSSCDIPAAVFEWYGWIEYNAQAISAMSASNYATLHYSVLKRATDALGQIKCNNSRSIPTSVLSGSGATLPLITYRAWIQEYYTNVDSNVALSYTGTGSSTGIADIVNYNTDLGASDAALVPSNYAGGGSDLQMLPAIAAAVVMVYNIPDIGQVPIMFTREVLPLIYMGTVTKWNDPLIASVNPSLTLPNASIVIVGRFDGSGTTSVFTQALSLFSPTFNQSVGVQQLVNWGQVNISGMAAAAKGFIPSARYLYGQGNGAVMTLISTTPYSLGYAVSADVLEAGLPFATMKNKAGNNVTANPVTINAALKEFADAFTSNFSAIVQDGASANAWPMTTYSYLLIHTRTMSECGKAASLLEFIMWTQTNSKAIAIAEAVGYTVMPAVVHPRFLTTLAGVTCKGASVLNPLPCMQGGAICSNQGKCVDGACICDVGYTGSQCQITPPGSLLQLEDNVMASFDDTPAAVVNLTGNLSLIEDPRTSLAASTQLMDFVLGNTSMSPSALTGFIRSQVNESEETSNGPQAATAFVYSARSPDNSTALVQMFAFHATTVSREFAGVRFNVSAGSVKWSINVTTLNTTSTASFGSEGLVMRYSLSGLLTSSSNSSSSSWTPSSSSSGESAVKLRAMSRSGVTTYFLPLFASRSSANGSTKSLAMSAGCTVELLDKAVVDGRIVNITHDVTLATASSASSSSSTYIVELRFPSFERSVEYDPSLGLGLLLGSAGNEGGHGDDDNTPLIVGVAVAVPVALGVIVVVIVAGLVVAHRRWRGTRAKHSVVQFNGKDGHDMPGDAL